MDAITAILTRRSIRKYVEKPVPDQLVTQLLRAGFAAPSAGNEQPWHFIVIDERRILDAIPEFHEHSGMLRESPLAIVICGDENLEHHKGFWVQDCAAATQNVLLAAHARGLGAVWLGVYPREERVRAMRRLLGLPQHVVPLSIVAVGYPAESVEPADRFDESRIHRNGW
jgi:nitroreductase